LAETPPVPKKIVANSGKKKQTTRKIFGSAGSEMVEIAGQARNEELFVMKLPPLKTK